MRFPASLVREVGRHMKIQDSDFGPRKIPKQQRALFTVDSIVTAARILIEQRGYEAASTNHIADMAGVSIGSLYQYFRSKESIVAAMVEDAILKSGEKMRAVLLDRMDVPLKVSIHDIVRHVLEMRREHGFVFRKLARQIPHFSSIAGERTTEKYLYNTTFAFYSYHRDEIQVENLEMAMFIVECLVLSVVDAYLDSDDHIRDDDAIVRQLSDAVLKYLTH